MVHCVLYKEEYNVIEPVTTKGENKSPDLSKIPAGVKIIDRINSTNFTSERDYNQTIEDDEPSSQLKFTTTLQ